MFITPKIRQLYEGQFNKIRGMAADEDRTLKAYANLNKMFRKFIKTADPGSDYAHRFVRMTSGMHLCPMYNPEIAKLGNVSVFCTRSSFPPSPPAFVRAPHTHDLSLSLCFVYRRGHTE